jgi:probable nitrogen fixation protein
MTEAALAIAEDDPIFESEVMKELVKQMRALDTYDTYEGWSAAKILDPFIMTKERKAEIPVIGDPDEITIARVKAFYNGIASLIEKECGLMAVPMMVLSHEGFGRVVISVGKLIVLDRTLRDVHRFGFKSYSKMKDDADKFLSIALQIISEHPDVAKR